MENQTIPAWKKQANRFSDIVKNFVSKTNKLTALFIILGLAILGTLFYCKSLFIAATLDGAPISRISVIKELERNSGRQALDIIITKRLIETEAEKAGITLSQSEIDAAVKVIEDQIAKQGGTLEIALAQQGMTDEQFREQLTLQKKMEKILEDKVQVTDEEVTQYMTQNKMTVPKDTSEEDFKNQIREQLKNQKFNIEADKRITDIKAAAKIQYYVDYGKPLPTPDAPTEAPASPQNQ